MGRRREDIDVLLSINLNPNFQLAEDLTLVDVGTWLHSHNPLARKENVELMKGKAR